MNSELQQMRATIKAIGDAVADLSQVCEALPQLFESKLASIRADVAANVAGLREALAESGEKQAAGLAELQASQATLAGQLTARCGAVEAAAADAVQTAEARTAEIIANNGWAVNERLTALETKIEGDIADVRKACDTFDLHASVKNILEITAGLNADVAKLAEEAATDRKYIIEVNGRVDEARESYTQALMETEVKLASAIGAEHAAFTERADKLADAVEANQTEYRDGLTKLREAAIKDVEATEERLETIQATMAAEATLAAATREEVNAVRNDFDGRINKVALELTAAREAIGGRILGVEQKILAVGRQHDEAIPQMRVEFNAAVDDVRSAFGQLRDRTDALENTVGQFTPRLIQFGSSIGELKTVTGTLGEAIDAAKAELSVSIATTADELKQYAVATVSDVRWRLDGIDTTIKEVSDKVVHAQTAADAAQAGVKEARDYAGEGLIRLGASIDELGSKLDLVSEGTAASALGLKEGLESLGQRVSRVDASHVKRTEELAEQMEERAVANASAFVGIKSQVATVQEAVVQLQDDVQRRAMVGDLDAVSKAVDNVTGFAGEIDQALNDHKAAALAALAAATTSLTEKIESAGDSLWKEFNVEVVRLDTDVKALCANIADGLAKKADAAEVERIAETFNGAIVQVNSASVARTGELADEVKQHVLSLEQRIGEVPALVERVEKAMEEKLAALPAPELPVPELGIGAEYDEGDLIVSLSLNGQTVMTHVPVDIGIRYRGIWSGEAKAQAGDVFTHKGSMWVCKSPMAGEPGKDFTGWQLAVKRGSDGKDGHSVQCYELHKSGRRYRSGDFLRHNNRLWQCAVAETTQVPEPSDISTTPEWVLLGGTF